MDIRSYKDLREQQKKEKKNAKTKQTRKQVIPPLYSPTIFDIQVNLEEWKAKETVKKVKIKDNIRHVKKLIEIHVGIPAEIQRITLFDAQELSDDTVLESLSVVNNIVFTVKVWPEWSDMINEIRYNKVSEIIVRLTKPDTALGMRLRQTVCLFMTVARGPVTLVKDLLEKVPDLDINARLSSGHAALHVAITRGQYHVIDLLLEHGAIDDTHSGLGHQCLQIARERGFAQSEKHLYLFQWKTRAANFKVPKLQLERSDLMQHQQFDSHHPIWINGRSSQKYLSVTLPTKEFSGTRIDAQRSTKSAEAARLENDQSNIDGKFSTCSLGSRVCTRAKKVNLVKHEDNDFLGFHQKLIKGKKEQREKDQRGKFHTSSLLSDRKRNCKPHKKSVDDTNVEKYSDYNQPPCFEEHVLRQYFTLSPTLSD